MWDFVTTFCPVCKDEVVAILSSEWDSFSFSARTQGADAAKAIIAMIHVIAKILFVVVVMV